MRKKTHRNEIHSDQPGMPEEKLKIIILIFNVNGSREGSIIFKLKKKMAVC